MDKIKTFTRHHDWIICDVCAKEFRNPDRRKETDLRVKREEVGIIQYDHDDEYSIYVCPQCVQ